MRCISSEVADHKAPPASWMGNVSLDMVTVHFKGGMAHGPDITPVSPSRIEDRRRRRARRRALP
jgi:hypothetical protein